MRILVVCPNLPYPPVTGGSIRIFNMIKCLSLGNQVDLIGIDNESIGEAALQELKKVCNRVYVVKWKRRPLLLQAVTLAATICRGEPFMVKYAQLPEFASTINEVTASNDYDIVQFEHSYTAINHKHISGACRAKSVITLHNVTFLQYYRIYQTAPSLITKFRHLLNWLPMMSWEPKISSCFDKTVVVSDTDRTLMRAMTSDLDLAVIPNGVDTAAFRPFPEKSTSHGIIMVGSLDYEPNIDAIGYFYREIFPLVRSSIPDCTFIIVGKNPAASVLALAGKPGIEVWQDVEDVREYYRKAVVSAVALRSGSGSRLKILESMALGVPVVSTTVGAEGLEVSDGEDILIADTPSDFAFKLCQVMSTPSLAGAIAAKARRLVESKYDWTMIAGLYERQYARLLEPTRAPTGTTQRSAT